MTQPADHPTLLRTPTWYGGPPDEKKLPLPAAEYDVEHFQLQREGRTDDPRTIVTVRATGDIVYQGIGPAEVLVSRAPF
ncbi:hypothetical protein [Acidovorax sp. LjRoot117]|uniref:hypothetical protein n=1 Tax=Acidovorax sp. LjRoot117 TaxID=3342255 RepID=UPI003ED0224C